MLIQKILCPTDLSSNSKEGVSHAISLAEEKQAQLVLLHVISLPVLELARLYEDGLALHKEIPGSLIEYSLREATVELNRFAQRNFGPRLSKINWRPLVNMGNVASDITAAACREEADIIIMAKRQRRLLSRILSRSISEAVSRTAPCPVLTVCPSQITRFRREKSFPIGPGILQGSQA